MLIMATFWYDGGADVPMVTETFNTEVECNIALANTTSMGFSFSDGYELGNTTVKEDDDMSTIFFCAKQ